MPSERKDCGSLPDIMLSLQEIIASNERLCRKHESMTAIFTGATDGIGFGTLSAFVKHVPRAQAFIIGRSQISFHQKLRDLQALNPRATLVFIEAQLSLISAVDLLCEDLGNRIAPGSIDLVCMSQGYAPLGGRKFTSEGLDEAMALMVYGRLRMVQNLISLRLLKEDAIIITVLGGGKEGQFFQHDPELLHNYSVFNLRGHFTTLTTLALDKLSHTSPALKFVHIYPGNVDTGLRKKVQVDDFLSWILIRIAGLILSLSAITPRECGERMLFAATTEKMVRGSQSLDINLSLRQSAYLAQYRAHGQMRDMIWDHIQSLFDRALAN